MTPLKFTPFTKQAIANHRLKKLEGSSGISDRESDFKTIEGERPIKQISLQSRLLEAISSPSVAGTQIPTLNN